MQSPMTLRFPVTLVKGGIAEVGRSRRRRYGPVGTDFSKASMCPSTSAKS